MLHDRAANTGRALQPVVVDHHQFQVLRQAQVDLQVAYATRHRMPAAGYRVFR
jgi:hypothetical protein